MSDDSCSYVGKKSRLSSGNIADFGLKAENLRKVRPCWWLTREDARCLSYLSVTEYSEWLLIPERPPLPDLELPTQ